MSRDVEDRAQTDESAFSVLCFAPSEQVTAVRAYRVKLSQGGPKGYKCVVLDISPDLPIQQKGMRVYGCEGADRASVETDVLKEIRDRHPDLLVRRHPARPDRFGAHDEPCAPPPRPAFNVPEPVVRKQPEPVLTRSTPSPSVPMSLNEARRTATMIASDESNALPIEDSVRNLARVLATVLALIAQVAEDDAAQ